MKTGRTDRRVIAIFIAGLLGLTAFSAEPDNSVEPFAFTGVEIFPIDQQIGQLRSADLDGDGLNDLIIANNRRSKINILYNRTGKTNAEPAESWTNEDINKLPPDARFKIESIASEKRIASLVTGDFNNDGLPDLAYYGEPKELIILPNKNGKAWESPIRQPISDGLLNQNALITGDINDDGLTDLFLLGEKWIYCLKQSDDHAMGEPEKLAFTGKVNIIQVLDINDDEHNDLLLVNWDSQYPFRMRLQGENGRLGPEIYLEYPLIRSFMARNLDGQAPPEVMTIARKSGRAELIHFSLESSDKPINGIQMGQFQVTPLTRTSKAQRGTCWIDLNNDLLDDLIVAEPDSGQVTVFIQQQDGSLPRGKKYPSLTGISEIKSADWDADGVRELFLLSKDENRLGIVTPRENNAMPFPENVWIDGRPLSIATGQVFADKPDALCVIIERDNRRYAVIQGPKGKLFEKPLDESYRSNPNSTFIHDVNQDGQNDIVILTPYEKIKILLQESGEFREFDISPPAGGLQNPWAETADIDADGKPELLLARENFVRALTVKPEINSKTDTEQTNWTFHVKTQINGAYDNSKIAAITSIPGGTNSESYLCLLDSATKSLSVCEKDDAGIWQVKKNLVLPVSDFDYLDTIRAGTNNDSCIAFAGLNSIALMPLGGKTWSVSDLCGYESPISNGHLLDVTSGDLNSDGIQDLVFIETSEHAMEILSFVPPDSLVKGARWKVFEERSYRSNMQGTAYEPREMLISDLTGDDKNDLAIVVHDRILLYPRK
ncbi:MAG: VCBS repeat-containing protein [Verrucomicrobia bacterium]|nr:VCBS repeat-containing protein [Verrucomicrobiota bacterium]MCF7707929.1 VCBS repeat-containing protein [Verrucomicrobiota bacterium]